MLKIRASMDLDQAMAEVRRYLRTRGIAASIPTAPPAQHLIDSAIVVGPHLSALADSIAELSNTATRFGTIEPISKAGRAGIFAKRIIRKAIGWYSKPIHEFDRTLLRTLEQVRHDMLGLQEQITHLNLKVADSVATTLRQDALAGTEPTSQQIQNAELLRCVVELLIANVAALQALQRALQESDPHLQARCVELLNTFQREFAELKAALLERLPSRATIE